MELEVSLPHSQVPATCPCPEPDLSSPCPTSHVLKIHLNIILPSMPGSPKWFLSLRFPHQNPAYTSPLPIRAACSTHLILLDLITRTMFGEEYRFLSSSFCSFLHSPVTSFILGPNILLSILSSHNLGVRSSLNVSDQVSYSYKTTGKIIVLYILIFVFFNNGNFISREMFTKLHSSRLRQHTVNQPFFVFHRV